MKRVCVFCGSRVGRDPAFRAAAAAVGQAIARRGLGLVYGGGSVGLMGAMADAALAAGGEVVGVIPRQLEEREIAHAGLSALHVVDSMHERKAKMADLADSFVALPGGLGTLEELFEAATWAQLGIHRKPIGLLDVGGYFASLVAFLDHAVSAGFLRPEHRGLVLLHGDIDALLDELGTWQGPALPRWVEPGQR